MAGSMGVERSEARRPRFNGFNTMRDGHFRLVTLGRLALERSDGQLGEPLASLNSRRRKVALLAVLALARRGVSRDGLVEMFWGDQDELRARHSLSDAISHLRRVLGREAIVATRSTVTLAPSAPLVVDAVELAAAAAGNVGEGPDDVATAAYEKGLALYAGPFLDGVYLEGSASFEQWVSAERARLQRVFVHVAALRCKALAAAGQWGACEELAERWLDAEPLCVDAGVTYLEALARTGEGDGRVLAAYDRLCARLRREYELEPSPEVEAIAARIVAQRRSRVVVASRAGFPEVAGAGGPPPTTESDASPPAFHHQSSAAGVDPSRSRYAGPRIAVALVGLVLIAAAFVAGASTTVTAAARPATAPVVAIAAIEPTGPDTSLAWLADGLPQMIAAKLSRSTDVEVVPPAQIRAVRLRAGRHSSARRTPDADELLNIGRRVGATVLVTGGVTRAGAHAVLELNVRTVPDGEVRRITVTVDQDILALVDQAAVQLLGAIGSTGSGPSLADLETPSIAAYQHFTRYAQIASEGRSNDALPELDAAIAIDSGFTGALLARLVHAFQASDGVTVATLNAALRKRGNRVPERDRLEWESWLAQLRGDRERSEQLARVLVSRYPRDTRGYILLADILSNAGRWDEQARVLDRLLAIDSLGMEAGQGPCAPCSAFAGLVEARLVLGDNDGAERAARRWITLVPDMPVAWANLARVLAYRGRHGDALATIRHALALSNHDPHIALQLGWILVMGRRLDAADSLIATWNASGVRALERHAADLTAIVQRERGQFRASNRTIERAVVAFPELDFLRLIRANGLARLGDPQGARQTYEAFHPLGNPPESVFRGGDARTFAWHHALLADALAEHADVGALEALADSIERVGARSYYGRDWRLHHHVRGLVAMRTRDLARAERELQQARWVAAGGWTRTVLELAKVKLARGRPLDAVATLRDAYAAHPDAMGRYLPRTEVDFWMAVAFRDAGQADSASTYAAYTRRAWANADPEVKAMAARLDR